MSKSVRDVAMLAFIGLVIGSLLGILAAGFYATWITGGDLANVGFDAILAFAPWEIGRFAEPFRTGIMVGGAATLATTIAVPVLVFRRPLTSHGSARWATPDELRRAGLTARMEEVRGPIYGKLGSPRSRAAYLTSAAIPHSLIAAPTGSGKGVGVVTPTLLTYPGSIMCLDPKGENFEKTARHREAIGDRVYKFAPYDPKGRTHRYNPLAEVAAAPERRRYTEARRLAASFIVAHGGGQGFLGGARDLFAATALLAIQRRTPTIGAIFDALSEPGEAFEVLKALGDEVTAPEAKKILHQLSGMESRILSSYLSVLFDGGLSTWADRAVRDATEASDFRVHDLRRDPASIFIVVAPNDLVPLAPLIRLMFQQTIAILQRSEPDKANGEVYPVLFLLDEFVSLGRMDVLLSAITTLRSYGGRVMIVVQSIASLRDLYGRDGTGTFLANCAMQLFMSPADEETPEYISRAIGDFTRRLRTRSWRGGELATTYGERIEGARLMRPEQIRMLGEGRIVALVQNLYPVAAHRVTYYEDRHLAPIFRAQTGPLPEPPTIEEARAADAQAIAVSAAEPQALAAEPLARSAPPESREAAGPEDVAAGMPADAASAAGLPTSSVVPAVEPVEGEQEGGKSQADLPPLEPMDERTERRVHAGLSRIAVEQTEMSDALSSALLAARNRNRARLVPEARDAGQSTTASPKDTSESEAPDISAAGAGVLEVLVEARQANRKRGEHQVGEDRHPDLERTASADLATDLPD